MSKTTHPNRSDVYSRVTDRIVADIERGVRTWQKPWNAEHPAGRISRPLRATGQPYRGINVLLLWSEALASGYNAPIWMTYRQAAELGAQVRKGEHGALVVFADRFTKTDTDDKGEEVEKQIPFMKGYSVFNVEQIDGLPAHYYAKTEPASAVARIEHAEAFFAATGATIRHGGNRAFYAPGPDFVQMPPRKSFRDAQSYCGTLAHELTHWTAHPSRLARELGQRFGDNAYAAEELIAEMGSAFLCADLGIAPEVRADHAQYLGHWLAVLKNDSRAIFTAAAQAQRAADYLHGLQPEPEPQPEPSSSEEARGVEHRGTAAQEGQVTGTATWEQEFGRLAAALGQRLPLAVCKSAAGFYLGTNDAEGLPYTRESVEYWPQRNQADLALKVGRFTQRPTP